jgi:hypothetical protein
VTRVDSRHQRSERALGRPAVVVRALVALSALFGLAVAGPVPQAWATDLGPIRVAATGTPDEGASTLPDSPLTRSFWLPSSRCHCWRLRASSVAPHAPGVRSERARRPCLPSSADSLLGPTFGSGSSR